MRPLALIAAAVVAALAVSAAYAGAWGLCAGLTGAVLFGLAVA